MAGARTTCEALLAAYGLRARPRASRVAPTRRRRAAARAIGLPVALKLVSDTMTHKSDVGGVLLRPARTPKPCRGRTRLVAATRGARPGRDAMRGALVQPMVTRDFEAVIGMTLDPQFGPLLMAGLGGHVVELQKDVAFRLHPLTPPGRGRDGRLAAFAPLFDGLSRRRRPADLAAFVETMLRVSQLVGDLPEIVELDLNPVAVLAPGGAPWSWTPASGSRVPPRA